MIKNKKQLAQAKENIRLFEVEIEKEFERLKIEGTQLFEKEIAEKSLFAQLEKMKFEVMEFDNLMASNEIAINSIYDLPNAIVKARIRSGYSQNDLAKKIEIQEQQIQRYEVQEYNKANLERVTQIIDALEMKVSILLKPKSKAFKTNAVNVNQEQLELRKQEAKANHSLMNFGN